MRTSETGLYHRIRHQEGDHDQKNARVREAGEGLGRVHRPGQHDCAHREQRSCQERKCVHDDREDRGDENGEKVPCFTGQPRRDRREPDAEGQGEGEGLFAQLAKAGRGCIHPLAPRAGAVAAWPNRARPLKSTTRPLTAPSSVSTTYCHWKV